MIKLLLESSSWEDESVDATYLDRVHQYQEDTVSRVKDLRAQVEDTVARLADTKQRIEAARDDLAGPPRRSSPTSAPPSRPRSSSSTPPRPSAARCFSS